MLKKALLTVCVVVLLIAGSIADAASTDQIDDFRAKALNAARALTDSEAQIIENFISSSFDEMLNSFEISEILAIKTSIVSRKGPSKPTGYSNAYNKFLEKNLRSVAGEINALESSSRKNQLLVNLIVLAAETKSYDLADFALTMIDSDNVVVRYWAVKCIANKTVIAQFNSVSESDNELNNAIIAAFDKLLDAESSPEILGLLATFAAQSTDSMVEDMLIKVVDKRIKKYEDWTVKNEFVDSNLLKRLTDKMIAYKTSAANARWSMRFAQLYSYIVQRYIAGADILDEASLEYLKSAIAEAENSSFAKLLGRTQPVIKKALEKKDPGQLKKEIDSLLGSASRQGRLAYEFKYDYGKNSSGQSITAPKKLPAPPSPQADTGV
ncbi:MAG: hypothetical protein KAS23_07165 [Anaerohalosphaera sp.]|nr:hypothetical protein [Anaerohalosphaera sp.]